MQVVAARFRVLLSLPVGVALIALLLFTPGSNAQQIIPDAAVRDFESPIFDTDTNRISLRLRGAEARFPGGAQQIAIDGLVVHIYPPKGELVPETVIESPAAVVQPEKKTISGEDSVSVQSRGFSLNGRNWTLKWEDNHLHIRNGVTLTLHQSIGPILQ